MVKIGRYNKLRVVKNVDFGAYLDGGDGVEILLPARYIDAPLHPDDEIDVLKLAIGNPTFEIVCD